MQPEQPPHIQNQDEEAMLVNLPASAVAEPEEASQVKDQGDEVIDPIQQMRNNNIVPLLAVIDKMDLTQVVDGKPLLSKLCTMGIPLDLYIKDHPTPFPRDADNRTPLHQAIAADDAVAAKWCLERDNGNVRDNFGNTPILEAIKLDRKSCFLLCLQHQYYDSEAPHICATYNRAWQIQALHRLEYDVVSVRDSQHFTPLERAVQNYGYDVAEFLTHINPDVKPGYLSTKTDSMGIIRLVQRVKSSTSSLSTTILPLLLPIVNLCTVLMAIQSFTFYEPYSLPLQTLVLAIFVHYLLMWIFGCRKAAEKAPVDFDKILRPPLYPPIQGVSGLTLEPSSPKFDYCYPLRQSVPKFHFYSFVCVYEANQVFWCMLQVLWMVLLWWLKTIIEGYASHNSLLVANLSNRWVFGWAVMLEWAWAQSPLTACWLVYLWLYFIYQFCCCFQLLSMMVLNRTHIQINNTQNYPHLYRVVRTSDGSFKSQEIRLMEGGLFKGLYLGVRNTLLYFFK